jgi:hypothetical protein
MRKMGKVINLDDHRPPPTISDDALIIACDHCKSYEYFIDSELNIWCSSCLRLAMETGIEFQLEIELEDDDEY